MRQLLVVLLCCLGLLIPSTPAAAGNIVLNGGFDTGDLTNWSVVAGGSTYCSDPVTVVTPGQAFCDLGAGVVDFQSHSGSYAAMFGNDSDDDWFLQQTMTTTPGGVYDLSFWLRNSDQYGATPNDFGVWWNGVSIYSQTNLEAFGYTLFSFTGLLATDASTVLRFGARHPNTLFQLDDVSVTPVPEPATLLLLGMGLGAVAARRRLKKRA